MVSNRGASKDFLGGGGAVYFQKMFAKFLIFSSSPKALKNPVLANFLRRRRVFEKIGIFRHFWTVLAKISRFFVCPHPQTKSVKQFLDVKITAI